VRSALDIPAAADDYDFATDFDASIEFAYAHIRKRVAAGGPGWRGWPANPVAVEYCRAVGDATP
jgi:hypothetical protein